MKTGSSIIILVLFGLCAHSQTITINPQPTTQSIPEIYKPGVFLVPRNPEGTNDFLNNGIRYSAIRGISIESAMNYWTVSSIGGVMEQLEAQKSNIMTAYGRSEKLVLPILKMPAWLSSSTDGTETDPGFTVFNGVPPADYATWSLLMDSIVSKLNDQWGLDPYYEIWNEPDIGFWSGTTEQYFEFFRNTYLAIKNRHPSAKVGGPTVSSFKSQFTQTLPNGYLTTEQLDSTIIGMVIDSCIAWNTPLDFISWHKFGLNLPIVDLEINYLNEKLMSSGHGLVPYLVSEWNLSAAQRESPLAAPYMINYVQTLKEHQVAGQMVAAWQDFNVGDDEFHHDYGLISWGGLHKPAWKALRLLDKLKGLKLQVDQSDYRSLCIIASYYQDTMKVLLSNYALPGSVVATFSLYFDHGINSIDLVSKGYDAAKLEDIYQGVITLSGNDPLTTAINSVIPVYQEAEALFQNGRNLNVRFSGITGVHSGIVTTIDSTRNNVISTYEASVGNGNSRAETVDALYPDNPLDSEPITMTDSTYSFHLQSNGVVLIELHIPEIELPDGVLLVEDLPLGEGFPLVYPNPASEWVHVRLSGLSIQYVAIYDQTGRLVKLVDEAEFSVKEFRKGLYLLAIQTDHGRFIRKFIKE